MSSEQLARIDRKADEATVADTTEKEGAHGRPSASKLLVSLAHGVKLWHTPDDVAYASIPVGDHIEQWPLRSKGFRSWLTKMLWESDQRAAPSQAMQDALSVLEGMAIHDGEEHKVHVRLAERGRNIYLDLADDRWRAVEVTANGWHVVPNPSTRFERRKGMRPLPVPTQGGTLDKLRDFVNVSDKEWPLILASLVGAFNVRGPHAVTIMSGEQGSGKSTNSRVMRQVIDPNEADLRSAPRDTRDLMIACRNGWICAFDNLSDLRPALSDDLARLATGAGLGTRALFRDDEETLFHACRPIICNGITDVVTRPDLLDRSLVIRPPRIEDRDRLDERTFWQRFDEALPGILGALLDAVSTALRGRDHVVLKDSPRMADFARWVVAAEPALPLPQGAFMDAYTANRRDAQDLALDADPVAQGIAALLDKGEWEGTAVELAKAVKPQDAPKWWPTTGQAMAGALRRAAPTLRAQGYDVEYHENARPRKWQLRKHPNTTDLNDISDETRIDVGSSVCQSPVTSRAEIGKSDAESDRLKALPEADLVTQVSSVTSIQDHSCPGCNGAGCHLCDGPEAYEGGVL